MFRPSPSLVLAILLLGAAAIAALWLDDDFSTGLTGGDDGRDEISGRAKVIDGDSLEIGRTRIRLAGIDAPEGGQPHGNAARRALERLAGSGMVKCISRGRDRYERMLAVCYAGKVNLNRRQVRGGHAWDYARYSYGEYAGLERAARREGLGLWAGADPLPPWEWRHRR